MKRFLLPLAGIALFGAGCLDAVPPRPSPGPVACTMEAKQCPDGSSVGRTGPNCEFAPCPPAPNPGPTGRRCTGPSDPSCGSGYECAQECGPPVVRDTDPPPGWSCYPAGKPRICPICLASNTMIATPSGSVNVRTLKVGSSVWTLDGQGKRVAATLVKVTKTSTPKSHRVVHLALGDGRQAWISPNHPTADGRIVGQLRTGDTLDGALVLLAESVAYWDDATYDLLPAGDTGAYWANGILMGSTLTK